MTRGKREMKEIIIFVIYFMMSFEGINSNNVTLSRQKRIIPAPPPFLPSMAFTENAATGILVAIGEIIFYYVSYI